MRVTMTTSIKTSTLLSIILITVLLAACGVATPAPMATATTLPSLTPSVTSTSTELPSTATPAFPVPTLTPSAIPISSPPAGLHIAYSIDGNIYFQNGSKPPLQLTHSGEDW